MVSQKSWSRDGGCITNSHVQGRKGKSLTVMNKEGGWVTKICVYRRNCGLSTVVSKGWWVDHLQSCLKESGCLLTVTSKGRQQSCPREDGT